MNLRLAAPLIALSLLLLSSCNSTKTQLPYFQDLKSVSQLQDLQNYSTEIKPDDELLISVFSSIPEATAHYNLPLSNPATVQELTSTTSPRQLTYIVDSAGDIDMPVLGKVHVAGLTTEQLSTLLTAKAQADVPDAIVRVTLVNFRVVVAGEVLTPKTIKVERNRFSVLDAISEAGDLTPYGERSNVLVIREIDGKRHFERLNLNSVESLTSPYFYLQQNDYVYVEPNEIRKANAKYNQNNAYKLTVISTIVSAASVVASLVIALAVK